LWYYDRYAPLFANVKYVNWSPNAIKFDESRSYGSPSYYTQLLYANSFVGLQPTDLRTVASTLDDDSAISASVTTASLNPDYVRSHNGSRVAYVIKAVNFGGAAVALGVTLTGLQTGTTFPAPADVATLQSATGNEEDENSLQHPRLVAPTYGSMAVTGAKFSMDLPKYSITILRVFVQPPLDVQRE
jgi:alpha-N-arabinofuranosidase